MAITRQRSVTPDAFLNPRLLTLSPEARLTEVGLRLYADNFGREVAISRLLAAAIFPLSREMRDEDMDRILLELDQAECIEVYDVAGVTYYQMSDWPAVQHPGPKSRHPDPPAESHEPFMKGSRESHGEGEGERERAWEGESVGGRGLHDQDQEPPSPFCPSHRASGGTDDPCRRCGRARLQRKVWDREQIQKVRFESAA
ncbi:hypothetical protein J2Y69_002491 [Microbacterium resistens]|uniref:Uncharacterized protein n=1 Tax=Microbacterium resistens TaxID=156977 RepID=A0ABU1SE40_9MICO|nr:hypothetical protein [Microbacterium resistens]MDR6867883.1 hypothetical protein [Microbacterium resistens]